MSTAAKEIEPKQIDSTNCTNNAKQNYLMISPHVNTKKHVSESLMNLEFEP